MELISVIVPVYNVEKYLDRCVQSIVDQTYRNLEIILVDDGSPDNCPAMCDAWAERDGRIKVIHKENGGAGLARNIAMDLAKGDIFSFVDSDDYLAPQMYEHLLSIMDEETDIAECCLLETEGDDAPLDSLDGASVLYCGSEEAMAYHIRDSIFRQTPPNKLYRRGAVGLIRFPVGNRIDDEFFTYRVIANARRLAHSDRQMYAYRQQAGSVMHQTYAISRIQAVDAKRLRLELILNRYPALVLQAKTDLLFTCLYQGQMSLRYLSCEDRVSAFNWLRQALDSCSLSVKEINYLPKKQRIWPLLVRVNFEFTCKLRNFLGKGIR